MRAGHGGRGRCSWQGAASPLKLLGVSENAQSENRKRPSGAGVEQEDREGPRKGRRGAEARVDAQRAEVTAKGPKARIGACSQKPEAEPEPLALGLCDRHPIRRPEPGSVPGMKWHS